MSVNYNDITNMSLVPIAGVPVDTLTSIQHNISRSSDEYSASKAYSVNDYCIHDNTLYRCKTACSAASWSTNSRYFEASSLTAAVTALNSDLNTLANVKTTTMTWTAYVGSVTSTIRKQGNIVSFTVDGTRSTYDIPTLTLLGTIPTGYRPASTTQHVVCLLSTDGSGAASYCNMTIYTDGTVKINTEKVSSVPGKVYNRLLASVSYICS